MGAKDTSLTDFIDHAARIRYAARVAGVIAEAMRDDSQIATDMLLRGRIGLAQMSDRQLLETGANAWGVQPHAAELRPALHQLDMRA